MKNQKAVFIAVNGFWAVYGAFRAIHYYQIGDTGWSNFWAVCMFLNILALSLWTFGEQVNIVTTVDYQAAWDELQHIADMLEQLNNLPHLMRDIEQKHTYKHVIVKNEVDRPEYERSQYDS